MSLRIIWFILGGVATLATLFVGGYLFLKSGGLSMATTANPLPLEAAIAHLALRASFGAAANLKNPLPFTETNLLTGAHQFKARCAFCHGLPGQRPSDAALGMFPKPPQLFENKDMVTDDPEGVTYWKITHGIRLSGMPGFEGALSATERWQITMLVSHADKLSPAVLTALSN